MEILDALREPGPDAVMPPSPLGVKHIPIGTRIRFANEVGEPAAKWLLGTIASVRGATQPFVYSVEVEDKVKGGTCIRELSLGEKGWSFDDPRDRRRYEILRATADGMTAMQDALAATGWNLVVSQGVATRSNKGDTDNEQAAGVQENEKSPKTVLPSVEGEGASPPVVDSAVAELQPPSAKMPVPVANGAEVSVVRKRGRPPKAKGDVATPDSTAQKGRGFPGEDAARTSLRAGAARGAQVPAVGATAAARGHAMNGNAGASAHGATPAASYSELPNLQLLLRPQAAIALVQQIKEYRECSGDRLSPDRLKEIDKKMKTLMQWSQTATDDDGISEAWNSAVLILHRMRELAGCQNVDNAKILQAFPMTPEGIGRVREYLKWLEVRLLHWVAYFTQGRPLSQEQGEKIVKIQESFEGSESDIRSEMQALIRERKLCMEHLQAENNSWMATCPMIARLLMLSHALLDPEETEVCTCMDTYCAIYSDAVTAGVFDGASSSYHGSPPDC